MFGRSKEAPEPVSDDLATFLKRVVILEARVSALELNQDAFRDKVLRKIQQPRTDEQEILKPLPGGKVRR